jgi:hypothetical protein
MSDSWCQPIRDKSGTVVSGGAARNVRIAGSGGMDAIVTRVAAKAAREALEEATAGVMPVRKPPLKLVVNC